MLWLKKNKKPIITWDGGCKLMICHLFFFNLRYSYELQFSSNSSHNQTCLKTGIVQSNLYTLHWNVFVSIYDLSWLPDYLYIFGINMCTQRPHRVKFLFAFWSRGINCLRQLEHRRQKQRRMPFYAVALCSATTVQRTTCMQEHSRGWWETILFWTKMDEGCVSNLRRLRPVFCRRDTLLRLALWVAVTIWCIVKGFYFMLFHPHCRCLWIEKTQLHLHFCLVWAKCVPDDPGRWFGWLDRNNPRSVLSGFLPVEKYLISVRSPKMHFNSRCKGMLDSSHTVWHAVSLIHCCYWTVCRRLKKRLSSMNRDLNKNNLMWTNVILKLSKISRLSVDNQPLTTLSIFIPVMVFVTVIILITSKSDWSTESQWMFYRQTSCSRNFFALWDVTIRSSYIRNHKVRLWPTCMLFPWSFLSVTVLLTVWTLILSAAAKTPPMSFPH